MTKQELLKIAKPILFNTEMTRVILDGRKTVTRRLAKAPEGAIYKQGGLVWYDPMQNQETKKCPKYQPGDILYVRETFCEVPYEYEHAQINGGHITMPKIAYKADSEVDYTGIWKPSIHMLKEGARIFLRVTGVRVERLQDITEGDCIREGIRARFDGQVFCPEGYVFRQLWNSTIKPSELPLYGWDANPWVWVYDFERILPE